MAQLKWRFPCSGHGDRKGLTDGDSETFKKSPFSAFAREILQNSIDARFSDEEPTKVCFDVFEIEASKIPDLQGLKDAMKNCLDFWNYKSDYVKKCKEILGILEQPTIKCLRVSDFNTTGLVGVETENAQDNKFLALAKGTGVSEKTKTVSGGSKGLGKNAAFLMSSLNVVVYSTKARMDCNGNEGTYDGYIGVADFISGYYDPVGVENRDWTTGKGFFSGSELNSAILEPFSLDSKFVRGPEDFGTDVFILGFKDMDGWEKDVINSILDSFMAAIVRGQLIVDVNGTKIDRDTVQSLVYDEDLIAKNQQANVVSQYLLLKGGDNVKVFDIETDYGSAPLYILPFSVNDERWATHKCAMIRTPLMKIRDEPLGSSFRASAMCVIEDGPLGKILRSIENPQHIDWEPKRMDDRASQKEMSNLLVSIRDQIKEHVIECLQSGDEVALDPTGAGDYLPDTEVGESSGNQGDGEGAEEKITVSKPKENITFDDRVTKSSDYDNGLTPDIGSVIEDEEGDVSFPDGENDGDMGDSRPGSNVGGKGDGDSEIFHRATISGIRPKVICTDKEAGKLKIIFVAPSDHDDCYLNISMLDDIGAPVHVSVLSMKCNGSPIFCDDNTEYGPFSIRTNQKITLEVETDVKGFFGSEVKIVCK